MIVVDSSALVAILFGEPEAEVYTEVLRIQTHALIAAPNAFEFRLVVLKRLGASFLPDADGLLSKMPIEVVAWDATLVAAATEAARRYGGRPARLNFGDCIAYALARSLDAPLLYKGDDFARTDIRSALD